MLCVLRLEFCFHMLKQKFKVFLDPREPKYYLKTSSIKDYNIYASIEFKHHGSISGGVIDCNSPVRQLTNSRASEGKFTFERKGEGQWAE